MFLWPTQCECLNSHAGREKHPWVLLLAFFTVFLEDMTKEVPKQKHCVFLGKVKDTPGRQGIKPDLRF
jgi:hypothetical protein